MNADVMGNAVGVIEAIRARRSRAALTLALAVLLAAPVSAAEQPPRAAVAYTDCVLEAFRHPGDEVGRNFDEAQDLAKVECANLRPAAVDAVRSAFTSTMTTHGDDPEAAAQAMLDIVILEQTAAVWAERHPDDVPHGR